MRPLIALTLFACLLGLTGCGLPKRFGRGGDAGGQPFVGTPSNDSPAPSSSTEVSAETLASRQASPGRAMLGGYVMDRHRRGAARAEVTVVEEDPGKDAPGAALKLWTAKDGSFSEGGFEGGKWYRLTARVRNGSFNLVGSARARGNDLTIFIALSGEEPADGKGDNKPGDKVTSGASLGVGLGAPRSQSQQDAPPAREVERQAAPPFQPVPVPAQAPARIAPPPPSPVRTVPSIPPVNTENMANLKERQGWDKPKIPDAPASIPNGAGATPKPEAKSQKIPAPPSRDGGLESSSAPSAAPPPHTRERPAARRDEVPSKPVVPSCVIIGDQVRDFTLYDFDGKVWRLRDKREGKLTLIDFWYCGCVPCQQAIPHLNGLANKYRTSGLQVVGIAAEQGSLAAKQDRVRPVRERYGMSYPTLFTGGGMADCPVLRQFQVKCYPTLVLIDESGKIVWRSMAGLDRDTLNDLEWTIRRKLGMRDPR